MRMCALSLMYLMFSYPIFYLSFFFNDTATTEIYTLSLHDALPICLGGDVDAAVFGGVDDVPGDRSPVLPGDRKSTRLNSSHVEISYAVFCLKKKKKKKTINLYQTLHHQTVITLHLYILRSPLSLHS